MKHHYLVSVSISTYVACCASCIIVARPKAGEEAYGEETDASFRTERYREDHGTLPDERPINPP